MLTLVSFCQGFGHSRAGSAASSSRRVLFSADQQPESLNQQRPAGAGAGAGAGDSGAADSGVCDGLPAFEQASFNCFWYDYIEGTDWRYHTKTGATDQSCAGACIQDTSCTGFEVEENAAAAYCVFWNHGACSSTHSQGLNYNNAGMGPHGLTYVAKPACLSAPAWQRHELSLVDQN